ncbi:hypothetical protein Pfo_001714 [Paulownia fortunei]|nr:hypothetical protein Pfo_001714 [Paulownia fortunei]
MGKEVSVMVVFWTIMLAMTTCNGTDQSPKAVEKWAKNLNPAKEKLTKLHFFCHHLHSSTAVTIAKAATTDTSPTYFGLLDTRDDPLTVGQEESSGRLGYAQGISAAASLEEISSFDPSPFTLAVMGSCPLSSPSCEAAVVGGTGVFRLARGWVTTKSYYLNFTTGKASLEINVVALHY